MSGVDGKPLPDIYLPDKWHMNAKGYALSASIIRPLLED
jgi:lysophospholipase L1-like esterase